MPIYNSISDYIEAKNIFQNTRGKIVDGVGYVLVNGGWVLEREYMDAIGGVPRYEPPVIQNPDGTHTSAGIVASKQR